MGKQLDLKFTPDLRFQLDETFDQMDATRRMFAQDNVRRDVEAADPSDDPDQDHT